MKLRSKLTKRRSRDSKRDMRGGLRVNSPTNCKHNEAVEKVHKEEKKTLEEGLSAAEKIHMVDRKKLEQRIEEGKKKLEEAERRLKEKDTSEGKVSNQSQMQ